jgi:N-acetyl-anhydromuramyl-L-alanine amidase AmpD
MPLYPLAISHPGSPSKTYPSVNARLGAICHSAEGSLAALLNGIDNGPFSWHFSVAKDGRVFQHYPLESHCWHAGSRDGNRETIGIEHEGVAGEPLTEPQIAASVALCRWLRDVCNWQTLEGRLFEHNKFSATACPSNRIPWDRYTEMTHNTEFVLPLEEPEVELRALNKVESIQALNSMAASHGQAIDDRDGQTMFEVTAGYPYEPPQGSKWYLATGKQ